jgi:hypothetical protein
MKKQKKQQPPSKGLSWFNQSVVLGANQRMSSSPKTSLGNVVSTPSSRAYANRAKKLSANPEKYTNQDYITGHKEEGLGNNVLSDPIAMAAALTAGGVGYGAVGLSQIPRMFGANLVDQMTFGVNPLGALKTLKQEALYRGINPVGYGAKQKALDFFPNLVRYTLNPENKIRDIGLDLHEGGASVINKTMKQKFEASLAHRNAHSYYDLPYEEAKNLFRPGEVSEILQMGKNRSDAFRIGLGLNQQHQTFDKIGDNLYRINPDKFNPTQGHLLTLDNDIAASKMNQSVTVGDDPRVALTKKYHEVTSPKVDTPYGAYSINDLRRFLAKESDAPKPWEQTRIVEKARNPEFEHSVYDADKLGIMGSYRWDVTKTPEGNLHFQSNDRWDINPWENRGKININNDDLQEAERLKHFKSPLQNVEMLKVMGGKPFNIQNNFIVNPKDYSVMNKYQNGGALRFFGVYPPWSAHLPQHKFGDFLGDAWSGIKNSGVMLADNATSLVNQDIIKDSAYTGRSANDFRNVSHVSGGIMNSLAPTAAGALLGPAGSMGMAGIQQGSNMFVSQDRSRMQSGTGQFMNGLQPFLGMAGQAAAMGMSGGSGGSAQAGDTVSNPYVNYARNGGFMGHNPMTLTVPYDMTVKRPNGGNIPATRGDSIALLNNTKALENYYKGYGDADFRKGPFNQSYIDAAHAEDRMRFVESNQMGTTVPTIGNRPRSVVLPLSTYYRPVDDNRYFQRESANGILDTRAPMALYDKRIAPSYMIATENRKSNDSMWGDEIAYYGYDKLAVTPWDMLNETQRKERIKNFGTSGTPFASPQQQKPKGHPVYPDIPMMPSRGVGFTKPDSAIQQPPAHTPVDTNEWYMGPSGEWARKVPSHLQGGTNWRQANPREYAMGGELNEQNDMNDLIHYNGPSHEHGGIPVNNMGIPVPRPVASAEVEGGETSLKGYVFSDTLKNPATGKTFADESKAIESRYKNRNDKTAQKSKEMEMSRLMASNEELRQAKEMASYKRKMGGFIKKYANGGEFLGMNGQQWGQFGVQNIGNLIGLAQSLKPIEKAHMAQNPYASAITAAPQMLDPTQALASNSRTYRGLVGGVADAVNGSGNGYLAGRMTAASQKYNADADVHTKYNEMNAGLLEQQKARMMQVGEGDRQAQWNVDQANFGAKAARFNMLNQSAGAMGLNYQGALDRGMWEDLINGYNQRSSSGTGYAGTPFGTGSQSMFGNEYSTRPGFSFNEEGTQPGPYIQQGASPYMMPSWQPNFLSTQRSISPMRKRKGGKI